MNKQALTGALAYQGVPGDIIHDAARLVERLLPGECRTCAGSGKVHVTRVDGLPADTWWDCHMCHGTGQVWDEGIVEAVAKALYESWINGLSKTPWLLLTKAEKVFWFQNARAVLSAIAELLTEKVEE